MPDLWMTIAGWTIFALWTLLLVPSTLFLFRRTLARLTENMTEPESWPTLSVIVPARDEGPNIEASLRSLLASDYPALEIIAVNDRSTDDTGTIMDRLADEVRSSGGILPPPQSGGGFQPPREKIVSPKAASQRLADPSDTTPTNAPTLRVIHVDAVPEGWLGKNHALHRGAAKAGGEFILFTDGDVIFVDDALKRTVKYALASKLDHLCLMPRMLSDGYWESALTTYFGILMIAGCFVWLVPTPFKLAYAGIGAFNLVRAEAYRAAGGHEPIRLDILDDVKLGKLMKSTNHRSDILVGGRFVQVKWQDSAWGVIRGLEKNAFAAVEYSVPRLIVLTLFWIVMSLVPYAAVVAMPDVRCLGYAATLCLLHFTYAVKSHRLGSTWLVTLVQPLAGLLIIGAWWRSACITLRQGGVRWRDTFYPLGELRRGLFR